MKKSWEKNERKYESIFAGEINIHDFLLIFIIFGYSYSCITLSTGPIKV